MSAGAASRQMAMSVAPERSVLLSTSMPSYRFHRPTHPQPRLRLVAGATLAAFLLAQSWMVCAPLCLLQGHARVPLAASQFQGHVMHCHSDNVAVSQMPTAQSLDNMLPTRVAAPLSPLRVVAIRFTPPAPIHLQQIPPADPPPPRSV